jgi:hypothetical protein
LEEEAHSANRGHNLISEPSQEKGGETIKRPQSTSGEANASNQTLLWKCIGLSLVLYPPTKFACVCPDLGFPNLSHWSVRICSTTETMTQSLVTSVSRPIFIPTESQLLAIPKECIQAP